jgi:hypothetical protein
VGRHLSAYLQVEESSCGDPKLVGGRQAGRSAQRRLKNSSLFIDSDDGARRWAMATYCPKTVGSFAWFTTCCSGSPQAIKAKTYTLLPRSWRPPPAMIARDYR